MRIFLIILLLTLASPAYGWSGKVARVVDGDTLIMDSGERIRLYGVDCEELGTVGGERAKTFLTNLIENEIVTIDVAQDTKSYGRLVALVTWEGVLIQEILVKTQLATISKAYCNLEICNTW